MNKVILIGNLTKDPEGIDFGTHRVCNFTLAINSFRKDNQADFIQCVAWNDIADFAIKWLQKGKKIGVVGRLQENTYTDSTGSKRWSIKVVAETIEMLSKKDEEEEKPQQPREELPQSFKPVQTSFSNDDLPF